MELDCQSLIWYFAANREEAGKQRRDRKTEESRGMEDSMTLQGLVVFQKDSIILYQTSNTTTNLSDFSHKTIQLVVFF